MEALACGTPVVASAAGGIPEQIRHDETADDRSCFLQHHRRRGELNLLATDLLALAERHPALRKYASLHRLTGTVAVWSPPSMNVPSNRCSSHCSDAYPTCPPVVGIGLVVRVVSDRTDAPICDAAVDVLDVTAVIERAFRGATPTNDPFCPSPIASAIDGTTDVNCSGDTNVLDVVVMIGVAFRGRPQSDLCDPCTQPGP